MNTQTNLQTKRIVKTANDMKILIVEDDITLTTLWNYVFKLITPDAKITWVKTADAAQSMLWLALERGQYFDIIVSDYFLPGQMTGLDLWMKFADYPTLFLLNSVLEKSKLMKKIENFQDKPIFIEETNGSRSSD